MNRLSRLAAMAAEESHLVLGLMSGTSLDGLDLALCRLRGWGWETAFELLHFVTVPYTPAEQASLRRLAFNEQVSLRELCILNGGLAERHAQMVRGTLADWGVTPEQVHLLASHGQTLYHAPHSWRAESPLSEPFPIESLSAASLAETGATESTGATGARGTGLPDSATLQIGDGDRLALRTGLLTLSDFRQKEIAGGGPGAPLTPYAQQLLFSAARPRILLNLGGIANFSWLPPRGTAQAPISADTGPANTLIDGAVRRWFPDQGQPYDEQGAIAARGRVLPELLTALRAHPYFTLPAPKSTGPELFSAAYLSRALASAGLVEAEIGAETAADVVATLTRLSAETAAAALYATLPALANAELILCGGGSCNRTLVGWLRELLPALCWLDDEALGVPPAAMEAVCFAVLAHESLLGTGFADEGGRGKRRLGFGKLSFPD